MAVGWYFVDGCENDDGGSRSRYAIATESASGMESEIESICCVEVEGCGCGLESGRWSVGVCGG